MLYFILKCHLYPPLHLLPFSNKYLLSKYLQRGWNYSAAGRVLLCTWPTLVRANPRLIHNIPYGSLNMARSNSGARSHEQSQNTTGVALKQTKMFEDTCENNQLLWMVVLIPKENISPLLLTSFSDDNSLISSSNLDKISLYTPLTLQIIISLFLSKDPTRIRRQVSSICSNHK